MREGPVRLWNRMVLEKGLPEGTRASSQIKAEGMAVYRERYNHGWRWSERGSSLDVADARRLTDNDAWMDGYLDSAAGREQYHIPFCPDHDSCN